MDFVLRNVKGIDDSVIAYPRTKAIRPFQSVVRIRCEIEADFVNSMFHFFPKCRR